MFNLHYLSSKFISRRKEFKRELVYWQLDFLQITAFDYSLTLLSQNQAFKFEFEINFKTYSQNIISTIKRE